MIDNYEARRDDVMLPPQWSASLLRGIFHQDHMSKVVGELGDPRMKDLPKGPSHAKSLKEVVADLEAAELKATASCLGILGKLAVRADPELDYLTAYDESHEPVHPPSRGRWPVLRFQVVTGGTANFAFRGAVLSGTHFTGQRQTADTGDVLCVNDLHASVRIPGVLTSASEVTRRLFTVDFMHSPINSAMPTPNPVN